MTEPPTCRTCRYWNVSAHTKLDGQCRRSPPRVFFSRQFGNADCRDEYFEALWPVTQNSAWCGEHPQFKEKVNE